jgi:hypothetical protein
MDELFFIALYLLTFAGQDDLLVGSQMTEVIRSEPWSAGAMEIARSEKLLLEISDLYC